MATPEQKTEKGSLVCLSEFVYSYFISLPGSTFGTGQESSAALSASSGGTLSLLATNAIAKKAEISFQRAKVNLPDVILVRDNSELGSEIYESCFAFVRDNICFNLLPAHGIQNNLLKRRRQHNFG